MEGYNKCSLKKLLRVIDNNTQINIVSEKGRWIYEGKVIFITSDLHERKVKLVNVKRAFINELFITQED